MTVDEACDGAPVALIKIDVEGHEAAVVRGAAETIAAHAPAVIFEYAPHLLDDPVAQTPFGWLANVATACTAFAPPGMASPGGRGWRWTGDTVVAGRRRPAGRPGAARPPAARACRLDLSVPMHQTDGRRDAPGQDRGAAAARTGRPAAAAAAQRMALDQRCRWRAAGCFRPRPGGRDRLARRVHAA